MTGYSSLFISALDGSHERSGFHCGVPSLDNYLHKQANQDVKRHISRVFVATTPVNPHIIGGYYTLSTLSIELEIGRASSRERVCKYVLIRGVDVSLKKKTTKTYKNK